MTDPDYFAVLIANQILGGDFNSYINMNLRDHGWMAQERVFTGTNACTATSTQVRNGY
jgi:predicted Zn-dependent peptidase